MSRKLLYIALLTVFTILLPKELPAYWGLRRIHMNLPDSVYTDFNAEYYAFSVSWARTEPEDDEYNWDNLDAALDFISEIRGRLILLFQVQSPWATDGESRAPDDLDRRTPLDEDPPEHGYSESIYDFVYRTVVRCQEWGGYIRARHYRYGPEPQYNWLVDPVNYEQSVEDYIRCLRTAYIAAHDAGAAGQREIPTMLSHGGFYYNTQLEREWFELGEENEELQDSLITLLQSRYERHAIRINSWQDLERRLNPRGRGMPPTYWMDAIAGQTDYLDWFDVHYHFKSRFIFDELAAFEHVVEDSGGDLKPWIAAEAAMQLAEGSLTEYDARFHAGDMARKWILGKAFGLHAICTPIVGFPPEHFFGLYSEDLEEYLSADAFRGLRTLDWHYSNEVEDPEIVQDDNMFHYREPSPFGFDMSTWAIDYIWLNALEDSNDDTVWYTPPAPVDDWGDAEYDTVLQISIFGDTLRELALDGSDSLAITQEPTVVLWYRRGAGVNEDIPLSPSTFKIESVYPNPFNSELRIDYSLMIKGDTVFSLYTIDGREVWRYEKENQQPGSHSATIGIGNIPAGVYLLNMNNNGASQSRKVVHLK